VAAPVPQAAQAPSDMKYPELHVYGTSDELQVAALDGHANAKPPIIT